MNGLSEEQLLIGLIAIVVILVVGRGSAEIARRFNQAEVLGELFGGFLIGPSVFGALFPTVQHALFQSPGVSLALSMFSWVGAILLLLIAGLEVDLKVVRNLARPGGLTAGFAIACSLIAGTIFAAKALGIPPPNGYFVGIVLSVTGVSVIAKILIERDSLRRNYAQVILAAGITSEVVVWPLISVVLSLRDGNLASAGRSIFFLVVFFSVVFTFGRRFAHWAMRQMADLSSVKEGQLSLVLGLTFFSAGITEALGLHALLGAFSFGVLLSQSPRTTVQLKESIQTLAVSLFAPIFFVLAGMRVDIFRLRSVASVEMLLVLFAVASIVKIASGTIGAKLGRLTGAESLLVGIGVNLKGGSDVIVAILGVQLGLLTTEVYTMYAVVAMITVFASQPLIAMLERKVLPSQEEMARLNREEARKRAYLPDIERVLVPLLPELMPAISARVVEAIAKAKQLEEELFDITELASEEKKDAIEVTQAEEQLEQVAELEKVEVTRGVLREQQAIETILEASKRHNLIAIAAKTPTDGAALSFGELQDRILAKSEADVMIAVGDLEAALPIKRILVPVNGHEHSMSAADLAAYVAKAHDAELVLFSVVHAKLGTQFWKERRHRVLLESGYRLLREVKFRIERLGVQASENVQLGDDVTELVLKELRRTPYQLLVMGTVNRGTEEDLQLGRSIQSLLTQANIAALVLVTH